jgi:hypothetical protein
MYVGNNTTEQDSLLGGIESLGTGVEQKLCPSLDDITFGDDIRKPDKIYKATLNDIIGIITNPANKEVIAYLRTRPTKEERNKLKLGLKYFLMGKFNGRRSNESMEYMVGMVLDYDNVLRQAALRQAQGDPFHFIQEMMPKLKNVWAAYVSPSGTGIKVIVLFDRLVKDIEEYRLIYNWVQRLYDDALGLVSDKTSDPARASYISYDMNMYVNPKPERLKVDDVLDCVKVREVTSLVKAIDKHDSESRHSKLDLELLSCACASSSSVEKNDGQGDSWADALSAVTHLCQQVIDYPDWIKSGMAIYTGFEDRGKELWDMFLDNPNYNQSQRDLDMHWRSFSNASSVSLKSLFFIAQKYGWVNPQPPNPVAPLMRQDEYLTTAYTDKGLVTLSLSSRAQSMDEMSEQDRRVQGFDCAQPDTTSQNRQLELHTDDDTQCLCDSESLNSKKGNSVENILRQAQDDSAETVLHSNCEENRINAVLQTEDDTQCLCDSESLNSKKENSVENILRQAQDDRENAVLQTSKAFINYKDMMSLFGRVENVPVEVDRLPLFLQDYLALADRITDAQTGAKLTSILPVIAANIGNRVYMDNNGGRVFCNVWSVIIGPSTVSRKTTVLNLAKSTMQPFEESLEKLSNKEFERETIVLSNVTSAKLLSLMSQNPNRLFFHNEISAFLSEMSKLWNQGMKQKITEIFDGVSNSNMNMDRCERIKNPALSLLAASTEGWFYTQLSGKTEQLSGFMQRVLYCIISDIDIRKLNFAYKDTSEYREELYKYESIYSLFRAIPLTFRLRPEQAALEYRNSVYQEKLKDIYAMHNDAIMSYYSRIYDGYWYKFCMMITLFKTSARLKYALEHDTVSEYFIANTVTEATAIEAMYMCDYYFNNTLPLMKMMSEQDKLSGERKLVEILCHKFEGRAAHTELMQYAHFDKKEMNSKIDTLLDMEVISVETGSGKNHKPVRIYVLDPDIMANQSK